MKEGEDIPAGSFTCVVRRVSQIPQALHLRCVERSRGHTVGIEGIFDEEALAGHVFLVLLVAVTKVQVCCSTGLARMQKAKKRDW